MWSKQLSKYPKHSYGYTHTPHQKPRKILTAEEYAAWLEKSPKRGDILIYEGVHLSTLQGGNKYVYQVVIDICEDFSRVAWDQYTGYPLSHEIVSCQAMLPSVAYSNVHPNWRPWVDYKPAPMDLFKENFSAELQDNLASAIKAYLEKRATLTAPK